MSNLPSSLDAGPTLATTDASRLPYQRPRLRTLHLAADEVLAVGCKMAGAAGPLSPASCLSSACFAEGS